MIEYTHVKVQERPAAVWRHGCEIFKHADVAEANAPPGTNIVAVVRTGERTSETSSGLQRCVVDWARTSFVGSIPRVHIELGYCERTQGREIGDP